MVFKIEQSTQKLALNHVAEISDVVTGEIGFWEVLLHAL